METSEIRLEIGLNFCRGRNVLIVHFLFLTFLFWNLLKANLFINRKFRSTDLEFQQPSLLQHPPNQWMTPSALEKCKGCPRYGPLTFEIEKRQVESNGIKLAHLLTRPKVI